MKWGWRGRGGVGGCRVGGGGRGRTTRINLKI